jgi:hypothetical protein
MNTTEKAYREILKVLNKYKTEIVFDVDDLENKAKHHLFGVKLVEKYGFELEPESIKSTDWQKLKENIHIGFWDGELRKISWSDDGSQPNKETLLCISYPTGAYMFGGDYPTEFFEKFFLELKTYKPKYIDSVNKSLYFSLDNAGKVYNAYDSIIKRYYEENKEDLKKRNKKRNIKKMKDELAKLEAQL